MVLSASFTFSEYFPLLDSYMKWKYLLGALRSQRDSDNSQDTADPSAQGTRHMTTGSYVYASADEFDRMLSTKCIEGMQMEKE